MAAALRHRGPDGHGLLLDGELGLVHTRLALIDPHGGAQPMADARQDLWIVGNGELYDHRRWRDDLRSRGHHFRTDNDIEVLLHAFAEWGDDVWPRLDGQFAAAIWHARRRELRLVRDRFGVVPLFYAEVDGGLVFASEAKALFAGGRVRPALAAEAISEAFVNWSVLPPGSAFVGVRCLPPGTTLRLDADGTRTTHTWWRPEFVPTNTPPTLAAAADVLHERLDRAVRQRLVADAKVAVYLSGGLDSSLLAALAARASPNLTTLGVRFAAAPFDEGAAQHRVRDAIGSVHHEVVSADQDLRAWLPAVVWHGEAPLLRTAPVPLFQLSARAHELGIKAVLSGEGADELFGGYSIFLEQRVRRFWARCPQSTARPALLARVHDFVADAAVRQGAMWQAFFAPGLADVDDAFYSHALRWRNNAWTTRVLATGGGAAALPSRLLALLPPGFARSSPLARAMAIEIVAFLSPYLLSSQGDRVGLAHGVESRHPFLAAEVAGFALTLPDRCKVRGLTTKVVLREVARRLLPAAIVARPKQPYRAPIPNRLFAPGDDLVGELLQREALAANPLLQAEAAAALVARAQSGRPLSEREGMALCGLLTVQLLQHQFVRSPAALPRLDRAPDVDVCLRQPHPILP